MNKTKKRFGMVIILLLLIAIGMFTLQSPELGSDAWCRMLEDTPKGEWTAEDVKAFTHFCIGRNM